MKISKKLLALILISGLMSATFISFFQNNVIASSNVTERSPIKVGVFIYDFNDQYVSLVKQNLEEIQKENENIVEFNFFDAKGNQVIQNESIDKVLTENYNLLIINLVNFNIDLLQDTLKKIKEKNIPLILYNEPDENIIRFKDLPKQTIFVASDINQSGILQGQLLVDKWNTDKESIDKNGDNIIQYVMLKGRVNTPVAIARTKYSISTINDAGIKTEEIASIPSEWNQDLARSSIESLFLRYGNKIEAIIANNDAMAIGAIEALQKYGYNKGDKSMTIPVVGIDGIPAARDLIQKGFMTGTVFQDPHAIAEALYTIGMNLSSSKYPLENTNYKFDNTGIVIRLPYQKYTSE